MPADQISDDARTKGRIGEDGHGIGYRPAVPANWPNGVDPGTVSDALDILARFGFGNREMVFIAEIEVP